MARESSAAWSAELVGPVQRHEEAVMEMGHGTWRRYRVVAVGAVGMGCAGLARKWISREIREAMLVRVNGVTRSLMEAIGMTEDEDVERGNA